MRRLLLGVLILAAILGTSASDAAVSKVVRGTPRADVLRGTGAADTLLGLGGNDRLSGHAGRDTLVGGSGADTLDGGPGVDKLNCGPGRDVAVLTAGDVATECEVRRGLARPPSPQPPTPTVLPVTGQFVPGMASFDRVIPELMKSWGIPGGAVAVVKNGRLVYARGYGYADVEGKQLVEPDALFRIASVSKPITAVATLKLVQEGRLSLDAKAYPMLPDITPAPGVSSVDPRIYDVTIRQLLTHTGGWDRDRSGGFDPMFRAVEAAAAVGAPTPASAKTVMRYMLGFPLDFTPGTRYDYSNFGYSILGRVIEKASGQTYEQYVKSAVLTPAGATRMRLGRTLESGRAPGEVRYYDPVTGMSVFPGGGSVPWPYGGFYLEAMDAHGGWLASTVDLLRFLTAVDGFPTRPDVLSPTSTQIMTARPPSIWEGSPWYYAMGWAVRPDQGNWWHDGSLPGTASIIVRTGTGLAWAAMFNAREMGTNSAFQGQIDAKLWEAVGGVSAWPAQDLFSQFP